MAKNEILDLGRQPLANGFLTPDQFEEELFFNLRLGLNEETWLLSLMEVVNSATLFNDSYPYRSSGSGTMRHHFWNTAHDLMGRFEPDSVLEIGSNDGAFLRHWNPEIAYGIEPCGNFAAETNEMGYTTWSVFWDRDTAEMVQHGVGGTLDLIYAANCMCHIPYISHAFAAVADVLSPDGVFVFEDPTVEQILTSNSYDQIYDEHAHIFSLTSLNNLLRRNGLRIFDVETLPVHGGSNRIYACLKESDRKENLATVGATLHREHHVLGLKSRETYEKFAGRVRRSRRLLKDNLEELKAGGSTIIGYGATSKSTVVYNYCGIGPDILDYVIDTTPEKQGKFTPGTHIPIVAPEARGIPEGVDYAFLGAWNFLKEIEEKEQAFLERGGRFITHVPEPRIIRPSFAL